MKSVDDRLFRAFHVTFLVGVLNAQDKLSAMAASKQPVEKGGARAANM
jgi:hypothetical protein